MTRTASPLRYPGGKSALFNLVADILHENGLDGGHYAEPFAGGGGLALSLLFEGVVREIHLNDIDPAVAAFWRSIIQQSAALCDLIKSTPVTIDEWHNQKHIYASLQDRDDDLRLGFATLFLNRTNRSGIIKGAGVIGGLNQKGNYLLDCRFNKNDLVKRIERISKYRHRIHFTQLDALDFLPEVEKRLPPRSLICPEITALYKLRRQYEFSVQYSAQTKRLGSELLIVSKGLRLPSNLPVAKIHQPTRQPSSPAKLLHS